MNSGVKEIKNYLEYKDYAIALRRLLDVSLYTENEECIRKAINLSQTYRNQNHVDQIGDEAASILQNDVNGLLDNMNTLLPTEEQERKTILAAQGISKNYSKGSFKLSKIDLEIRQGEIIGIVGENGNGKTTFLRCLGGQLEINSGHIDYPLFQNKESYAVRSQVAFIPQRIPRWYGLLKDNLHFSAAISGLYENENELMVDYILERLGLTEYQHLNWSQISSGYRTRFEIARVLLQKPQVLILDEPLANLDINTQEIILNDLRFIAKSATHPFGILLSSQQLHEVEKVADKIVVLKQGKQIHEQIKDQQEGDIKEFVIEIETKKSREEMAELFFEEEVSMEFNGGFLVLTSEKLNAQEMIRRITEHQIPITYYRDITFSTKRFF